MHVGRLAFKNKVVTFKVLRLASTKTLTSESLEEGVSPFNFEAQH
jgi:hypothetical protein